MSRAESFSFTRGAGRGIYRAARSLSLTPPRITVIIVMTKMKGEACGVRGRFVAEVVVVSQVDTNL